MKFFKNIECQKNASWLMTRKHGCWAIKRNQMLFKKTSQEKI